MSLRTLSTLRNFKVLGKKSKFFYGVSLGQSSHIVMYMVDIVDIWSMYGIYKKNKKKVKSSKIHRAHRVLKDK